MRLALCFALVCGACGGTTGDDSDASDAASDTSLSDGATTDATNDAGDGACPTPADVSGFTPAPMHPAKIVKGSCTTSQIDDYFKACFTPTGSSCNDFMTANPTCVACLRSNSSDPTWGAAVYGQQSTVLNTTGCIVGVTGDSSSTSCAQKYDDVNQCVAAACKQQCPIATPQDITAYEQCTTNAQKSACASFVADECAADAGFYQQCIAAGSNDPEAAFDAIGAAMCGP